jgi:hypothetical protein
MGIPGLVLWLIWTAVLIRIEWKIVHQLRGTPFFPLGIVILFFSFITLIPAMATSLSIENYITNAYLFLLLGILYSLPSLKDAQARTRTSGLNEKAAGASLRRPVGESLPLPS